MNGWYRTHIDISLSLYLEYGIRFPLTGGELHYVSYKYVLRLLLLMLARLTMFGQNHLCFFLTCTLSCL